MRAWALWDVTWRDVIILDKQQRVVEVYNLTTHNLADPANKEYLKRRLRETAAE